MKGNAVSHNFSLSRMKNLYLLLPQVKIEHTCGYHDKSKRHFLRHQVSVCIQKDASNTLDDLKLMHGSLQMNYLPSAKTTTEVTISVIRKRKSGGKTFCNLLIKTGNSPNGAEVV